MAVSHGVSLPPPPTDRGALGSRGVNGACGGGGREQEVLPGAHLLRVLLEASGEVTYNGVVSMRKESFLSREGFQWELKMHQKSRPRLVPVGARGGSSGRESTVHLDLAETSNSIVLWSEH